MAYEFHYTPTGTGVISGKEVLEQTEDAINDLGGQISGDVQTAIDTANNALNTANTASADAQNAINTANTAYTAATNAQNTANTAQNTASNALTAAQNAQNDVNALGNRVTTAEGNITQNTNAITGLTTRMGTAEGNIGNLQTAVSTAQATANSAQQTATTARQQSYVLRYSSTAITDNSTIAYSTLDNTDNIKTSDKIIDSDGKIFSIVSIDSANETVTVGSALIDLALDANVMHLSGNETVGGFKTFDRYIQCNGGYIGTEFSNNARTEFILRSNRDTSGQSGVCISKFRQNKAQGEMGDLDVVQLTFDVLENSVRTNRSWYLNWVNWENDVPKTVEVRSLCEKVDYKLTHINGLEPSALGMPDLDNGIDISSYFDISLYTGQTYTPPANGWISFSITSPNRGSILCEATGISQTAYGVTDPDDNNKYRVSILIPCQESQTLTTYIRASGGTVNFAKFYPCQGNV